MGFFKDFKRDFAQAVNELMPDKDELAGEYDDEDMVNTFDEGDDMEIAPEDMLEDIDDYGDDMTDIRQTVSGYEDEAKLEQATDDKTAYKKEVQPKENTKEKTKEESYEDIPSAELISEHDFNDLNELPNTVEAEEKMLDTDEVELSEVTDEETQDELKSIDSLDEANMLEGIEDAKKLDSDKEEECSDENENYYGNPFDNMGEDSFANTGLHDMDLEKDIEEAMSKNDDTSMTEKIVDVAEDEPEEMEGVESELPGADKFREEVMAEVEMSSQTLEKSMDTDSILAVDTTYITKGTSITGDITTEGSVDVLGNVKGDVTCGGKLIIGGTIKGKIDAGDIYANAAKVEGEVKATGSVKIGVGSIIVGNVEGTSAVISGAVNGDIDVKGPVIVDSTAVIMGNIKSRSVQINNGAVIEGFCSQCYSEIDVKSFFELDEEEKTEE